VSNEKSEKVETSAALIPIEEKTVDFYGDEITAALVEIEGKTEVYVPVRPVCEYLGLTWSGQFARLKRDPILSKAVVSVHMMRTEIGRGKGSREVLALRLDLLPGWLFGIDSGRVKPEMQDKIIRYQTECFRVLWQAFQAEARNAADSGLFDSTTPPSEPPLELIQLRELGRAIMQMAEQQIELERRVNSAHSRLDNAAQVVSQIRRELGEVKRIVQPGAIISEAQAQVISSTVKALAEYLASKGTGKNHYQGIFAELYRRFQVADYRRVRQADYQAVLAFLDDWQHSAGGSGIHTQTFLPLEPES
jgi:hypothetical protein